MDNISTFTGKRLFILRHQQALNNGDSDKTRHLSPKGKEDAIALGVAMKRANYTPDLILCSPALRTKQTLEGLAQHIKCDEIETPDILYSGSTGDYLYEIQKISDDYNDVLILAHNPSIYELVILLAAQGPDAAQHRLSEGYSPGSLSVIECASDKWAKIQPVENTLRQIISPIDYNAPSRPTRWM
tara:strand:+ start:442 stop:999 length:558 start_codon:yes stop_codon:yes gene_type:complete